MSRCTCRKRKERGKNNRVSFVCTARNFVALAALGFVIAAVAPVGAGDRDACDMSRAMSFRDAGDRYHAERKFIDAAHWYLAATRSSRDCRTTSGALLSARSLAQAGAALALGGDYLGALTLLQSAQSRLAALAAGDVTTAPAARSYADLVQHVIAAINHVAEASM